MLQLEDVSKSPTTGDFTQVALDRVSIAFRDNEFVAILGPPNTSTSDPTKSPAARSTATSTPSSTPTTSPRCSIPTHGAPRQVNPDTSFNAVGLDPTAQVNSLMGRGPGKDPVKALRSE